MVVIQPVTTRRDLKRFIMYPWKIYRGTKRNENWVPPLIIDQKSLFDTKKHPFFEHAEEQPFLALRNGEIVGRISCIIDEFYIRYKKEKTAYFGFYESIDDQEVALSLFEAAENWARSKGMTRILGPISPTPNQLLGLLINAFDRPPVVQVPYNPPYYPNLFEKAGLEKEKDHYAYLVTRDLRPSDKIKRVAELAKKRGKVTFRLFDTKRYWEEVEIVRQIYNSAWAENSDFVPWTEQEFNFQARDLKHVLLKELAILALVDGVPAGFALSLHDVNQVLIKMNGRLLPFGLFKLLFGLKKLKGFRLAILGIRHEYRNMGIDAILIYESYTRAVTLGMNWAELSLILEDNDKLVNMLDTWGASRYKTYRVFQKDLRERSRTLLPLPFHCESRCLSTVKRVCCAS